MVIPEDEEPGTKWLERKTSLIYDYEEDTINYGRGRPIDWNTNKRIHLPKYRSQKDRSIQNL